MASLTEPGQEPIKLRVANQKAYLWDLNDIQRLRVQHHICGSLHGTLPQVTQQNVFLGLPLVLAPEEVVLLVKHRIAVIVDEVGAHTDPTGAQADDYADSRRRAIEHQQRTTHEYEERKKVEMHAKHRDKIDEKRRAKLEKKRSGGGAPAAAAAAAAGEGFQVAVPDLVPGQPTTGSPCHPPAPGPPPPAVDISSLPYTILIDPSSSSYPWYDPDAATVTYATLADARAAGVWAYPQTQLQRSRCRVFEDLWAKGYYMGGGLRFGGDFLIYPGDPLRYHSHFTLTVLSTPVTAIMPLDLVAYGRLATAVKKAHLLASWNARDGDRDDEGEADYLSLEWAAFG
ncbi:hypothetical protein JCM11491_006917 [Sporobolomyces phaffii]